jgi:hypothetical protein
MSGKNFTGVEVSGSSEDAARLRLHPADVIAYDKECGRHDTGHGMSWEAHGTPGLAAM